MPGAAKLYTIEAYLFDADQPLAREAGDHWYEFKFDVMGLNTLPQELASKIFPIIGPVVPGTLEAWQTKRLPILRNSLSYHGAEHGVGGFPATTLTGKTYKTRVMAYGKTERKAYNVTMSLCSHDEPETILGVWERPHTYDLTAAVGEMHTIIGKHFAEFPDWNVRRIVARIKSALAHGKSTTQQAFEITTNWYVVVFKVEPCPILQKP